jgi:hypothetical protein
MHIHSNATLKVKLVVDLGLTHGVKCLIFEPFRAALFSDRAEMFRKGEKLAISSSDSIQGIHGPYHGILKL